MLCEIISVTSSLGDAVNENNNYVDSIMKTIKSSKILAIIIVASIALIGIGSLTDAIDKIVKFSHSYIPKITIEQKFAEPILLPSKTTTKQASTTSTIVVIVCIVILFLSLAALFIRWRRNVLSFEIDHNLILLHDFWEKFQGFLSAPLSVSEAFCRTTQVVIGQPPIETAKIGSIESEVLPCWHRKIFDLSTSLNSLSVDKQQNVRQFYDNLDAITSIYGKVIKLGDKVIGRTNINEKLEDLVVKVLEQGNPLKNHLRCPTNRTANELSIDVQ